ncbi:MULTISPECIES: LapA family protein [unclassified Meridianimarinicoccus]|uniref:LapA family protein n=1 Tax=unclassified Meridianimarinicoccus TaxID=2923344 RepID=UPI0018694E1E|nr:LapA family protein [Fluviibacterium sp. MJW13]
MRTIKYLFLAIVAVLLITIGFANRQTVILTLLPDDLVPFLKFNYAVSLPLYVVVLGAIGVGLLLGFIWEWIRESKHRSEAVHQRREKAVLAKEVEKMKADRNEGQDDVLALLDDNKAA